MGLNAVEWAAFSRGKDLASIRLSSFQLENDIAEKEAEQVNNQAKLACYEDELSAARESVENEKNNIAQTEADIEQNAKDTEAEIEARTAEMLSTEISVNKFAPNQGMNCGMGMGMGDTYTEEGAITLTAEELVALSDVLADFSQDAGQTDNSKQIAEHLNNTLTSGAKATAGTNQDGTKFVTINRADGSSVKICDANGNGALDVKDYDFCKAIKQAKEIIEDMKVKNEATQELGEVKEAALINQKEEQHALLESFEEQVTWFATEAVPNAEKEIEDTDEVIQTNKATLEENNTKAEELENQEKAESNMSKKKTKKAEQEKNAQQPVFNFFYNAQQQEYTKQKLAA